MNTLYTIGYCRYSPESFLDTMRKHDIGAVVDVRANPYSRTFSFYNQESINKFLRINSIYYLSFAKEFGGRPKDPGLYTDDKLDPEKFVASENFKRGTKRLAEGLGKFNVCLMCAQKDPIICHRAILVSHQFRMLYPDVKIIHITPEKLETQAELDRRVLAKFHKGQAKLLGSGGPEAKKQEFMDAYAMQLEESCI